MNAIKKSRGEPRSIKHFFRLIARHPKLKGKPEVQTFLLRFPKNMA
jgi:hypothetical protein